MARLLTGACITRVGLQQYIERRDTKYALNHFLPFFPPLPFFFEGVLAAVPASSFADALPDAIAPDTAAAAVVAVAAASFAESAADFDEEATGTAPLLPSVLGGIALEKWRSCILLVKFTVSCSKRFSMTLERLLNLRHCESMQSNR